MACQKKSMRRAPQILKNTRSLQKVKNCYVHAQSCTRYSVSVGVWLVRTFNLHTDVICLLFGQCCRRHQVLTSNLLVQLLRQQVHLIGLVSLVLLGVLKQVKLCQHLVCERARHHKGGMTSCTSKIAQAARCQNDDTVTIWEHKAVHLWPH